MATVARHSVIIKKYSDVIEEFVASAAITPGHLVELYPTTAGEIRVHSTPGGNALPMFALENEMEGQGIGDAYAHEDPVQVWVPGRGDIVNALLKDGEHVEIGDFLESAGDGTLQEHATDSAGVGTLSCQIVGVATEHVDLSDSVGTHPASGLRIKVRII
jgi:hypothetical protein